MMTTSRSIHVRGKLIPVVLPRLRDPRLHVAGVIISIHVLGQLGLGFRVSIPQIVIAIATCAVIEVTITYRETRQLVWPASAMLTGSGVALIFRMLDMEVGDYWALRHWHLFALVAGGSLLSKYLIRWGDKPLFNPSNVGLVVAFLVLGNATAEPLDFWWGPLDTWMFLAYAVIIGGGIAITGRLRLLPMVVAFWLTLFASIGVLSASGHCFTARWSFAPVCGTHFWWILITSPEVMIFLFFMITDPRTIPAGRVARVAFGASTAVLSTLLIAPQRTEFGAKVGLLSGLVILTAFRPMFARAFPEPDTPEDSLGHAARMLLAPRRLGAAWRGAAAMGAAVLTAVAVVAAGAPARRATLGSLGVLPVVPVTVDAAPLPPITIDPEVVKLDSTLAERAPELAEGLITALGVEAEVFRRGEPELLAAASVGTHLLQQERRLSTYLDAGSTPVAEYEFSELYMTVTFPFGPQGGAAPGFEARGIVETVSYDASGLELDRTIGNFAIRFALHEAPDGRWLVAAATPLG